MRVAKKNSRDLGQDRRWEIQVLAAAAAAGLAPAVAYADAARGVLITRWVEGRAWSAAETHESGHIGGAADLARQIHALPIPRPPRVMNPASWVDYYGSAVRKHAADDDPLEPALASLRAPAAAHLRRLAALAAVPAVVCHSDLHRLNLIEAGGSLLLLDWEYAHAADPFWDLAGWGRNNDFTLEQNQTLLGAYLGRPPLRAERHRLGLLAWLYDYVCLLWSALYLKSSGAASEPSVLRRALQLAARLSAGSGSRVAELPAH